MTIRRLIFLDVDGPLVNERTHPAGLDEKLRADFWFLWRFDPCAVMMMHALRDQLTAKIVWNSTWNRLPECRDLAAMRAGLDADMIEGETDFPDGGNMPINRLTAVERYLEDHHADSWCIIDDEDIPHSNVVRVSGTDGISWAQFNKIKKILKRR